MTGRRETICAGREQRAGARAAPGRGEERRGRRPAGDDGVHPCRDGARLPGRPRAQRDLGPHRALQHPLRRRRPGRGRRRLAHGVGVGRTGERARPHAAGADGRSGRVRRGEPDGHRDRGDRRRAGRGGGSVVSFHARARGSAVAPEPHATADLTPRGDDLRGDPLDPLGGEPVGGPGHRQGGHHRTTVVQHRRGDGVEAGLQLLQRPRVPVPADPAQLLDECVAACSGTVSGIVPGSSRTTEARSTLPLEVLCIGVIRPSSSARRHGRRAGSARTRGGTCRGRRSARPAALLQRPEQPERGRLVDVERGRELADPRLAAVGQQGQQGDGPVDRLHPGLPSAHRVAHCATLTPAIGTSPRGAAGKRDRLPTQDARPGFAHRPVPGESSRRAEPLHRRKLDHRVRRDRPVVNPYDASTVTEVDQAGPDDVDRAVAAARRAFDDGPWRRTTTGERGALLGRIADLLVRDRERIARLETLDTGKTIAEGRQDVDDVTAVFRYYAGLADKDAGGSSTPATRPWVSRIVHEPVGVCA
ncbi:hypothetical protein L7F22_011161 [Adiantum nelumboides]|nr:hypothetical protein [Adiantum nelumboides]